MNKCRFFIADMDERFIARVRGILAACPGIEIVGNTGNGRTALTEILRLKPDVVMTDIPLPEMDGITLLHETRRLGRAPSVIICTGFYSEPSMRCACRYGAAFYLCKPVELSTLPELVLACGSARPEITGGVEEAEGENAAQRLRAGAVRALFREIGMPLRLDGAAYFMEAAIHCHDNALLLRNLSKGLYAQLAQRMDATVSRVERSMRSAIAIAYERGSLNRRFPYRPSNREFLEYLFYAIDQAMRAQNL